jgi:ParB-like chromosome segregation protein Spo0J
MAELVVVPVDAIEPCPIQPRVNVSVDLVAKLADSMRAGRHEPVIEVEPAPGKRDRYQIVCGEQRWRAAREAGLDQVLVRIHVRLGYLERLEKQYEENRLRADLDISEEAHCIVLDKTIRDIAVAEQLLRDSLVPFQPLDDRRITSREKFGQHLTDLKQLLVRKKVHTVRSAEGRLVAGPLSPWRETDKTKVAVLRLDPDLLDEVRTLPSEHAIQIAKLDGRERQAEVVQRTRDLGLTCREVQVAVDRLREDKALSVDEAVAEARSTPDGSGCRASDEPLIHLADLCRQLVRLIANLDSRLDVEEQEAAATALADLRSHIDEFLEAT